MSDRYFELIRIAQILQRSLIVLHYLEESAMEEWIDLGGEG